MTVGITRAAHVAMIAGCMSFLITASGCAKKVEKPKGRPPALVLTTAASHQDVPVQLKAIGTMEASESVTIRTQISGELFKVAFREGQDVQKGAPLFQLDPRTYQAAIRKAEATLARDRVIHANALKDYERYSQLVKDGIVTQEQAEGYRTKAESAAADVAADQAALDNAREQLAYCTITAPISGRLGVLAVDRGNVVKANDTVLVTINKLTPIHASFTIPEKELPEIKRHMTAGKVMVEAEVPGTAGAKEKGVVSFFDNTVDPATGTIRLKGSFENTKKQLWPGQFVNLSITLAVKSNAVVVPSQAVQTGQKGQFVFVVKQDATAEIRPIVTGPVSGGITVIEKGLQSGEQVVIDGQMRVVPGGKVEIKQPDKPVAPQAAASSPVTPPKPDQQRPAGK
jgi:multidrug efflux system membrane fusion protein